MRQVLYCLCPRQAASHPSNIQNAADLLFTLSVHNYAGRHKTHGPRDTPPPSCHNNRVQQFLTLILSGSCYLYYGFLKELWTQRRPPLWLFLWRKTQLGLSPSYFHLVDLIRHFNKLSPPEMVTLDWRFIMNYKLPVLEPTCGHLYESRNSRFSESNVVKNRGSLHTSTVSRLSTGDGSIMATRRCLHLAGVGLVYSLEVVEINVIFWLGISLRSWIVGGQWTVDNTMEVTVQDEDN